MHLEHKVTNLNDHCLTLLPCRSSFREMAMMIRDCSGRIPRDRQVGGARRTVTKFWKLFWACLMTRMTGFGSGSYTEYMGAEAYQPTRLFDSRAHILRVNHFDIFSRGNVGYGCRVESATFITAWQEVLSSSVP